MNVLKPGASSSDVNKASIDIIEAAGYKKFEYGIGHGVGLEIHEEPFMRQNSALTVQTGMVATVEPGVYIPGWGGIRIEDTVLVTEAGCIPLTHFPKDELLEL